MALKTRLKFRINTKILLTLLLLSLLPLVSFVLVFQFRMTSLNEYVERELIDKSKRDLQRLAKDQAAIADAILDKVMTQTYIIDHFASTLWDNRNPLSSRYRHSYSSYEKQPGDIYSASAYTLVPNVSFDMVRKDLDLSSNMDDIFMAIFDNHAELLFSIDAGFQNQLDSGTIQNGLRQKFIDNETTLSQNAAIEKIGNGWRINNGQKTYIIRKEENKINIYESAILDKAYIGTESGIFREYPWNSTMLFSIDVEFQNQLDSGIIPEELRRKFIDNEIALSQNATIGKVGNGWQINDGQKTYIIRKEENEINTYDNSFYPRNRPWYRKAVREGKIVWTKYRDWDKNKYIFTCSSPVFKSNNILVGVVGVDITLETISQRIINTPEEVPGYAFLVNEDGTIIAKEDGLTVENDGFIVRDDVDIQKKEEEEIIITPAKESGIIKQMMNRDKDGGIDFDELNYIAYAPIPSGKLSVGIVMPFDSITELAHQTETRIEKVQYILITILIIMIFVVIGMAYRQAKKITKPILALNQGAKIVGGGNLDYLLDVKTGDEIEDLANTFNKMTDNLKIYVKDLKETTAAKERIESELKIATQIQASMLPRIFPAFPDKKEFDIFATMEPAKEVGGDFYDFFFINENKLCFLIGDVSGKGVPAALFMVISKTLLKTEALRGRSPDDILFQVNNTLYPDNDNNLFVTVFCVILDIKTGEVQFANAGHNPPLIYNGGDFEFLKVPNDFVVGPMPDTEYEPGKLILKPNDVIFLYTDGVTEAMNPESQLFSDKRLIQCLSKMKGKGIEDIIHGVRAETATFAQGAPQSDDITLLALKFNG